MLGPQVTLKRHLAGSTRIIFNNKRQAVSGLPFIVPRTGQAGDDRQCNPRQPQPQGQPRGLFIQRQILCDHIPIHKSLPFPIGLRTNLATKKAVAFQKAPGQGGAIQHTDATRRAIDHGR